MRIKLTVEYFGGAFCGWQRQENGISVQQVMEEAVEKLSGERVHIEGSGRTDAGVHAKGQTAHFDTHSKIPPQKWAAALNAVLPQTVKVLRSQKVDESFHARFDAKRKSYVYRIYAAPVASPLRSAYFYHEPRKLDFEKMKQQAAVLLGTHDFKAFMASGSPVKSTVRTIENIVLRKKGGEIEIEITGNGFLYNMVRIIAGSLVYVGLGKIEDLRQVLNSKDRVMAGITLPPHGLCLKKVEY